MIDILVNIANASGLIVVILFTWSISAFILGGTLFGLNGLYKWWKNDRRNVY